MKIVIIPLRNQLRNQLWGQFSTELRNQHQDQLRCQYLLGFSLENQLGEIELA